MVQRYALTNPDASEKTLPARGPALFLGLTLIPPNLVTGGSIELGAPTPGSWHAEISERSQTALCAESKTRSPRRIGLSAAVAVSVATELLVVISYPRPGINRLREADVLETSWRHRARGNGAFDAHRLQRSR